MKMSSAKENGVLLLSLEGELDHHVARGTMQKISNQIDVELPHKTVIDFSGLGFMDSSGIAVVMNTYKKMREIDGTLMIERVPKQAAKVFAAAGVNKIISINNI